MTCHGAYVATWAAWTRPSACCSTQAGPHRQILLLTGYAALHDVANVDSVLKRMEKAGIPRDGFVYAVLISLYRTLGDSDKVQSLIGEARMRGVELNAHLYTSMVSALATQGDHAGAVALAEEAMASGHKMDSAFYNALLLVLLDMRRDQIPRVLAFMRQSGTPPTLHNYNMLLFALSKLPAGLPHAEPLLPLMKMDGVPRGTCVAAAAVCEGWSRDTLLAVCDDAAAAAASPVMW